MYDQNTVEYIQKRLVLASGNSSSVNVNNNNRESSNININGRDSNILQNSARLTGKSNNINNINTDLLIPLK